MLRLLAVIGVLTLTAAPAAGERRMPQHWDWHWKPAQCSDFPDAVMRSYHRLAVTNDTGKTRRLYADWTTIDQGVPYESSSLTILGARRTTTIRMYTTAGNTASFSVHDGKGRVIKAGSRQFRCESDPVSRLSSPASLLHVSSNSTSP